MLGEKKLIKGIHTLGRKAQNTVTKLGKKANGALNKVENTVNRVDNAVGNAIDKGANIGQKIIDKSGKITDGLRAGSNIANAIATNLDNLGVPGANTAHAATRQLSKGAKILDKKRDNVANRIENARQTAQLEKNNIRKRIDEQTENARNEVSNFV